MVREHKISKVLDYRTVVVSDAHLGKRYNEAALLGEFLNTVTCDNLILNGDLIDGSLLKSQKQKSFSEIQRRVLDAVFEKVDAGSNVVFLPGNHDAAIRKTDLMGARYCGIYVTDIYDLHDIDGRIWRFTHGDRFDTSHMTIKVPDPVVSMVDHLQNAFMAVSKRLHQAMPETVTKQFSFATAVKQKTKVFDTPTDDFKATAVEYGRSEPVDGIICGHVHVAEWESVNDEGHTSFFYGNSGEWVENATALVQEHSGQWQTVDWYNLRAELGYKDYPKEQDFNRCVSYRDLTDKLILDFNKVWPGRDFSELYSEFFEAQQHMLELSYRNSSASHMKEVNRLFRKIQRLENALQR